MREKKNDIFILTKKGIFFLDSHTRKRLVRYYLIMESYRDADFMNDILYKEDLEEADVKRLVRRLS